MSYGDDFVLNAFPASRTVHRNMDSAVGGCVAIGNTETPQAAGTVIKICTPEIGVVERDPIKRHGLT
jgi:hypothetical protein